MSENFNLETKVTVKNIAPWDVGFPNFVSLGSTTIPPSGTIRIKREEIIAQIQRGNKLFGIDEYGSHATLYIDDAETRKYLEFDSVDGKRTQSVLTPDKVKGWFELKTFKSFEKNIKDNVVTRAEKQYLLKIIKDLKLNEYDKIQFCQEYCKFRLR
jgi:hypothetical protein